MKKSLRWLVLVVLVFTIACWWKSFVSIPYERSKAKVIEQVRTNCPVDDCTGQ